MNFTLVVSSVAEPVLAGLVFPGNCVSTDPGGEMSICFGDESTTGILGKKDNNQIFIVIMVGQ